MRKGYIERCERKTRYGKVDYIFTANSQKGKTWTRESAQNECTSLNNLGVEFPSADGLYICRSFQVEERNPDDCVIFCVAPFIPQPA